MINRFITHPKGSNLGHRTGRWVAIAALAGLVGLGLGLSTSALAQAEPTLNQVYEAANAGKLDQAQVMMQQVLVAHPGSAKAYFVQAELFAKQGKLDKARDALASAEKIAPGLPFAKADSVQNLRTQLNGKSNPPATSSNSGASISGTFSRAVTTPAPAAPTSSFPWGVALALGGAAIGLGIYMSRKKATAPQVAPGYGLSPGQQSGGLNGQQSFGMGAGAPQGYGPTGYGQPGFGQPAAQPGMGLGGKVVGGLAAGLAVGAGVMAAQAIGKSLMGGNEHPQNDNAHPVSDTSGGNYQPFTGNNDLGGQNFGVTDSGSWDDSSSVADSGGGGDWDS